MAKKSPIGYQVIEACFVRFGSYNSNDMVEYYGIKRIGAQRLFSAYKNEHLPPVIYDKVQRKHIALQNFKPIYINKKDATEILRAFKIIFGNKTGNTKT